MHTGTPLGDASPLDAACGRNRPTELRPFVMSTTVLLRAHALAGCASSDWRDRVKGQCDLGANVCATPHAALLKRYVPFGTPSMLAAADSSSPAMPCPGAGYACIQCGDGEDLSVRMLLCPLLADTLVSPQAIIRQTDNSFDGFGIESTSRDAFIVFRSPQRDLRIPLLIRNGLYFFGGPSPRAMAARVASKALVTELWHMRLGHVGVGQLQKLVKCSSGIPPDVTRHLHPLRHCDVCSQAGYQHANRGPADVATANVAGARFHIDFGFMRASDSSYGQQRRTKDTQRVVRSVDGFCAYLLVVDAWTCYVWVFPTKDKSPPLMAVRQVLTSFGRQHGYRAVRVDLGGELARSGQFSTMVQECGYAVEPTGADCAWMNGKVERLNRTFGTMVRALLYSSGLSPDFWSKALTHAVYLKNRMYHSTIGKTPYEMQHGTPPDLGHIRVFGARVTVKKPGKPAAKLDRHTYSGIFVGHTATPTLHEYYDLTTGRFKRAGNIVFDEAHFASSTRPPGPQLLYDLGFPREVAEVSCEPVRKKAAYPVIPIQRAVMPKLAFSVPLPLGDVLDRSLSHASAARCSVTGQVDIVPLELTDNPFGFEFEQAVAVSGSDDLLGFDFQYDSQRDRLQLMFCRQGQPAARIPRWRSRLRHSHLMSIDGVQVYSVAGAKAVIQRLRQRQATSVDFVFAFDDVRNALSQHGVPQIYFDQMRHIRDIINTSTPVARATSVTNAPVKLTRRKLLRQDDWDQWQAAEYKQLDQYDAQQMFGAPVVPPSNAAVFNWVWVYVIKTHENNRKKARAVCDGSTRGGHARVFGHTYAATPDLTEFRLLLAVAAVRGLKVYGSDVTNAFAEAPAGKQRYFMNVDDQYASWYRHKFGTDIPRGHVIPVNKNLQGHPEAPRLWSKHINGILKDLRFLPTTHAPCLYTGSVDGAKVFVLRQVDDFAVAAINKTVFDKFCDMLDKRLFQPITRQGLMVHYNGLDIAQTQHYVRVHCTSYVDKMLERYEWQGMKATQRLPMRLENTYVKTLDNAEVPATDAERESIAATFKFKYRQAIGELIWAMISCRPDIAFPVVKLSQFSTSPAAVHFEGVKYLIRYVAGTRDYGITYWRVRPLADLPDIPAPRPLSPPDTEVHDANQTRPVGAATLYGFVDADWGVDICHRRSITGVVKMFGGGAIAWKTRVQPTMSMSSTEAEFIAASDAGRMALWLRSILHEIGVEQQFATLIFEDNRGARLMTTASQPTRNSRHIAIREFAVLDWVERDLLAYPDVPSELNASDICTKQTPVTLFFRHIDLIMGRNVPSYVHSYRRPDL